VLSALFTLLTLAAYCRWVRVHTRTNAALVLGAFTAALLAKPMAMTIPGVLLLLDWWPLRRLSAAAGRGKLPLVALAAAASAWALVGSARVGAVKSTEMIALSDRIGNAIVSYVAYLRLAFWPTRLSPWYSHPALEGPRLAPATVALAAASLVVATVVALRLARRLPYLAVGWLWYLGTLFPVIGLVQVGEHAMADRYTYVPLLGIFIAVVWAFADLPLWRVAAAEWIGAVAAVTALVALALLTYRQVGIWHDPTTFWRATLAANPRSGVAHYVVAGMLVKNGHAHESVREFRRALKLRPDFVLARNELGNVLAGEGRFAAAAAQYRKAIAGRPNAAEDESNLANVLLSMGNAEAARRHLERALAIRPDFAEAHNNLGIVLAQTGHMERAVAEFRAAIAADPSFAAAHANLATALAQLPRPASASAN